MRALGFQVEGSDGFRFGAEAVKRSQNSTLMTGSIFLAYEVLKPKSSLSIAH